MLLLKRVLILHASKKEIVTMPNYFSDYDTTVHFISEEEMKRDHSTPRTAVS